MKSKLKMCTKTFGMTKNKFDNSDYPESLPYFDKTNKKVIGKFKDEAAGVPICELMVYDQRCIVT